MSTHSPLMVQSTTDANLAVLQLKDGQVVIENEPYFVKNWRVDQILTSDLFGLSSARNLRIEGLITERNTLLDKRKRTTKEEKRLRESYLQELCTGLTRPLVRPVGHP